MEMTKQKARNPQIALKKEGVFRIDQVGIEEWLADPIYVTAFATAKLRDGETEAYVKVKFKDRTGAWKNDLVPSAMLSAHLVQLDGRLARKGYIWPAEQAVKRRILGELSMSKPEKHINIVFVPGWQNGKDKTFVTPNKIYAAAKVDRNAFKLMKRDTVECAPFNVCGQLEQWQKKIAPVGKWSSRARTAIATVFAAPNLRHLGMDSFGLNFEGPTSSGKSLLLYLASSAAGFDRPTTWDGTAAGFEQRALGHRECVTLIDDLSHREGNEMQATQMAKVVTFRLAGNRPKTRAGQYASANGLVDEDYRTIALSTSETPIWQNNTGATRGEEVRMMNVRACVSDVKDIFDGLRARKAVGDSLEERITFVEQRKALCLKLQGTPFDAYLERRVSDNKAEDILRAYMANFREAAPLPEGARAFGRIRQNFAVVYASAAQAIDYDILPWKKKATLKDIKACFDDAVAQLAATATPPMAADADLVRQFASKLAEAKFVNRQSATAKMLNAAAGIKQHNAEDKVKYFLFARIVEEWFPDVSVRKRLTAALAARGLIKIGRRKDTRTVQTKLAAFKRKVPCYAIKRRKVLAYAG
jgi:uncharacterized protein (DUF927 family)